MKAPRTIGEAIASLLEERGTIRVKKDTYHVRITQEASQASYSVRFSIRSRDSNELEWLRDNYGGNLRKDRSHARNATPRYIWELAAAKAVELLKKAEPFLDTKRLEAVNAVQLGEYIEESRWQRQQGGPASPRPKELSQLMERCYMRAKELHQLTENPSVSR